ncbi:MAG TPA: RNA polymerase sigma factor [Polyangiaceae bacterium]|nr:RNA polymerase sigma factor [Polyangiaceae bacterium]
MGAVTVVKLERAKEPEHGGQAASGGRRKPGDEEIEQALEQGDRRAAVVLCSRHHGAALGRLCMAMLGSQQDAEDIAQETLIDAHDALATWRGEGSIRGFLMTIARRKCARLVEKRSRRTAKLRLVHDADETPPSDEHPDKQLLLKQRGERARAALAVLRPSEREALLLRYGTGLSFREVGAACGIDEAAARKRVSRAIARLRETLREEESHD